MAKLYNAKLITSEVCLECNYCCKNAFETQPFPESDKPAGNFNFFNTVIKQDDHIKLVEIDPTSNHEYLKVVFSCPKLQDNGKCSIYEDRPMTCRDYNCFDVANKRGETPRNLERIRQLIKKIHKKDVFL